MSAAEFAFWIGFRARYGFATDRIEGATAISGSYVGSAYGGKARPADLVLKPNTPAKTSNKQLIAQLSGLKGARVRRVPRRAK